MATKQYKPTSPGIRHKKALINKTITVSKPSKNLVTKLTNNSGRSKGKISVRAKGGRGKIKYRNISFNSPVDGSSAIVKTIEYDPCRSANISLISFANGQYKYILHPEGLTVGSVLYFSNSADIKPGNTLQLKNIPTGTSVFNVELNPGRGSQLIRSAGAYGVITAKNDSYVSIKLPSGEVRLIHSNCSATIGQVSNSEKRNSVLGKAGAKRWIGKRPKVRGAAMNPNDHPHGGGEGKAPIGKSSPVSPQGKKTLGKKTRSKSKSSKMIITRRK